MNIWGCDVWGIGFLGGEDGLFWGVEDRVFYWVNRKSAECYYCLKLENNKEKYIKFRKLNEKQINNLSDAVPKLPLIHLIPERPDLPPNRLPLHNLSPYIHNLR